LKETQKKKFKREKDRIKIDGKLFSTRPSKIHQNVATQREDFAVVV
jgi:hypothetical protein